VGSGGEPGRPRPPPRPPPGRWDRPLGRGTRRLGRPPPPQPRPRQHRHDCPRRDQARRAGSRGRYQNRRAATRIRGAPASPIALALRIEDAALAERLAVLLADVAGINIVAEGDADLVVSPARAEAETLASRAPALTAREREVVALLAEGLSNK